MATCEVMTSTTLAKLTASAFFATVALLTFGCASSEAGLRIAIDPDADFDGTEIFEGIAAALDVFDPADRGVILEGPLRVSLRAVDSGAGEPVRPHARIGLGATRVVVPIGPAWRRHLAHELAHVVLRSRSPAPSYWIEEGVCEAVAARLEDGLGETAERLQWTLGRGATWHVAVDWIGADGPLRRTQVRLPRTVPSGGLTEAYESLGPLVLDSIERGSAAQDRIESTQMGLIRFYTEAALAALMLVERSGLRHSAPAQELAATVRLGWGSDRPSQGEIDAFALALLFDLLVVDASKRSFDAGDGGGEVVEIVLTVGDHEPYRFDPAAGIERFRTRFGREILAASGS